MVEHKNDAKHYCKLDKYIVSGTFGGVYQGTETEDFLNLKILINYL